MGSTSVQLDASFYLQLDESGSTLSGAATITTTGVQYIDPHCGTCVVSSACVSGDVTLSKTGQLTIGGVTSYPIRAFGSWLLPGGTGEDSSEATEGCTSPVPAVPRSLAVEASNEHSELTLTWQTAVDADKYEIFRSLVPEGPFTKVAETASPTYEDLSVENCVPYYYEVRACSECGCSDYSQVSSGRAGSSPAMPTGVMVTGNRVTWSRVAGASVYEIFRSPHLVGASSQIGATDVPVFLDEDESECTEYWYHVRACNECGCSDDSQRVRGNAGAAPSMPIGVSAVGGHVSWSSVSGASEYDIFRSSISHDTGSWIGSTGSTSYVDQDSGPCDEYWYSVRACNECGCGELSSPVEQEASITQIYLNLRESDVSGGRATVNGVVWADGGELFTPLLWDWGDGSQSTSWFPASHFYSECGTYPVSVTARECEIERSESLTVVIPAGIDLHVILDGVDGTTATFQGNVETTDCCDLSAPPSWDWGDGSQSTSWFPASHTYSECGAYTVTVTVSDCGITRSESVTVEIVTEIDLGLWLEELDGTTVTANGYVGTTTDCCELSVPLSWDWGDGTQWDGWFPGTHSYSECGSYTIVVTANGCGLTRSESMTVEITECDP